MAMYMEKYKSYGGEEKTNATFWGADQFGFFSYLKL